MAPSRKARGKAEDADWVDEQIAVITASPSARVLVSAGPGTGKTAVTCARIAHLITECDVQPGRIWLVSFTRTAIHELRQRISAFTGDAGTVAGLKIATLDSHTWSIQSGFDAEASLTGSYEDNIKKVIRLIRSHEGVGEYLATVKHVFVDEAQDVVGIRCELVLELIHALPAGCGVTVMADEAQSIYQFSEDSEPESVEGTLPEKIREYFEFEQMKLTEIHRTDDPTLVRLFGEGRGIILTGALGGKARLDQIRTFLEKTNHGPAGQYRDDVTSMPRDLKDAFLLFRKRGEALEASSYLTDRPHRLRMSGLPTVVHPWIALILWDWPAGEIGISEFERRWRARVRETSLTWESAWRILVRVCGVSERVIDSRKLSTRLAGGAPHDLCDPDFGSSGPVVGTIHAAKGREAAEVRLYLPPPREMDEDAAEEEARVLFVGATRAREKLHIGRGQTKVFARRADSGRAYTPYTFAREAKTLVEIGRHEDISPEGLVGRRLFNEAEARSAQKSVLKLAGRITTGLTATADRNADWRYVVLNGAEKLCFLSKRLNSDLSEIARKVDEIVHANRLKPPKELRYLRSFGVRTIALAADDPQRQVLHAPWCDSGFILAPLVVGYSMVFFGSWGTSNRNFRGAN